MVWWCIAAERAGESRLVLEDDVEGVDDTRDETQDGQGDVDEQVDTAAALEEDTQRREEEGKDDFANVGSSEGHCCGSGG